MSLSFGNRSIARRIWMKIVLALFVFAAVAGPAKAQIIYLTNFAKTNNI